MRLIFIFIFFILSSIPSFAHKPSDSYITLKKCDSNISLIDVQWDIALRDLDYAIGLDDNGDGEITWGEVKKHHKDIEKYALPKLKMSIEDKVCKNEMVEHLIDNHTDGTYEVIHFRINCQTEERPKKFDLSYRLFFDFDPQHRGLLNIRHKENVITAIFSPEKQSQHFNLNSLNPLNQFIEFIKEGIWHIWLGFDHILFLLALLLPSVLFLNDKKWEAVTSFKTAFWNVFKIVTAFTVAHSITLALAALKVVELPSQFVESLIAASVVLAGLNNIFPIVKDGRWFVAFGFGLIHGFGFANVLMDLGLPKETLLIALVSFNIGVEIGQLAIVSGFLPIAYSIHKSWIYQKIILLGGSFIICSVAFAWFIERVFNLKFMPF